MIYKRSIFYAPLREICEEGQRLLRLQDWEVKLCIVNPKETGNAFPHSDCQEVWAWIQLTDTHNQEATIYFLHPKYNKEKAPRWHLVNFLHELVHLRFHYTMDLPNGERWEADEERAVNAVADVLAYAVIGKEVVYDFVYQFDRLIKDNRLF
jgi:hypothetical protein